MTSIEMTAKTTEDAISHGLEQLGVSISDVKVEILEEGSKGLFGLFGSRPAKIRLTLVEEESGDEVREIFTVPFISTFIAIFLFLTRLPVPALIADTAHTLGSATVPMSMLIIGISLSRIPVREALGDWRAYVVSLTRLILCPVLSWLVMGLFLPRDGSVLGVYTVTAACPAAAMITILSIRFGADDSFASNINFVSTVLCALTMPLVIFLLL